MPTILIVDDHPVLREGMRAMIAQALPGWGCSEAGSAADALRQLGKQRFALIILDLTLQGRGGLEFLADLHRGHPHIPIVVFSIYTEEQFAARCLRAGAAGYLSKGSDRKEVILALQRVVAGGKYIRPAIAEQMALESLQPNRANALSNREYEVLCAIAKGKSLTLIARELLVSIKTVSTHKRRLMAKLGVNNNAELIRRALEQGILDSTAASDGQGRESIR